MARWVRSRKITNEEINKYLTDIITLDRERGRQEGDRLGSSSHFGDNNKDSPIWEPIQVSVRKTLLSLKTSREKLVEKGTSVGRQFEVMNDRLTR